jgi:predicted dienelactone hydrolase
MQKILLAAVAIALGLAATLARAAGFRFIEVPADADGPSLTGAMWYPCADPPGEIHLGPLTLPGVRDCPISGDKLPLVVVSHGDGGQWWGQHDTAETLADAGFVVAAINHPGDSFGDMSRSGDLAKLKLSRASSRAFSAVVRLCATDAV